MSGDSSRITADRLSKAEAERRYWKSRHEAALLRNEVETMSPDMFAGIEQKRLGTGKPTPLDRAAEAHTRGIELNMFQRGLNGGEQAASSNKPSQLDPNVVIQTKAAIVEALATNHSPQEIETYLAKISPFLDVAMLAGSDPLTQSLLYAKIMGSNQQQTLTVKDVIELVATVNNLKTSQQPLAQSDPAALMNAAGNLFRTGVETARGKNDGIDITQVLAMQQQSHDKMLQAQQEHFRELKELQAQQPTLVDSLQQYRELQSLIGTSPDKPEVAMKKLELMDKREQREFEHSVEAGKQRAQSQMLNGVVGALSKLAESPIIREAGRGVGQALGKASPKAGAVVDAVTRAPQTAARAELNTPPTETPWGLVCHKCKQQTIFTQLQLAQIEAGSGRWSCPCGEVYELKRPGGETGDGDIGSP